MDGDWFGMAASAAGGGVFGVVGTALGRLAGYFEMRQQNAFEEKKWAHDVSLARLTMEADAVRSEMELATEREAGAWDGLSASLHAQAALVSGYPFVDAIRALTRPALTLLLWVITALVFFNVDAAEKARIVETAVFAATAATLWWFGDRSSPTLRSGKT
ncbi:MAG: hypothetical protein CMK07_13985 [Ponticaulis sp.]|nr:hypothetical protein [Ponticaulis sp.]